MKTWLLEQNTYINYDCFYVSLSNHPLFLKPTEYMAKEVV